MKRTVLFFILLFQINGFAQATHHNIMIGLSSEFSLLSCGYEYTYRSATKDNITHAFGLQVGYNEEFRLNLSFFGEKPKITPLKQYVTINGHYSMNFGKSRSKLELGIGAGGIGEAFGIYPLIGYRLIPLNKYRISFRITANYPILLSNTPKILFLPIGINLGFSF